MKHVIRTDIPIKYQLDAHASLPSYPTKQDVVFDIVSYLVRSTEGKGKKLDTNSLTFTSSTLKQVYGDRLSGDFLQKLKPCMESLVKEGTFTKDGETITILQSEFLNYFSPIK